MASPSHWLFRLLNGFVSGQFDQLCVILSTENGSLSYIDIGLYSLINVLAADWPVD